MRNSAAAVGEAMRPGVRSCPPTPSQTEHYCTTELCLRVGPAPTRWWTVHTVVTPHDIFIREICQAVGVGVRARVRVLEASAFSTIDFVLREKEKTAATAFLFFFSTQCIYRWSARVWYDDSVSSFCCMPQRFAAHHTFYVLGCWMFGQYWFLFTRVSCSSMYNICPI